MFKKILMIFTAFLLVFNVLLTMPVHGGDKISDEARICRDLGILKGDTGVVDSAYLQKKPNRIQAAIMYLRLRGLEDKALSYKGTRNFKDADAIVWMQGRNVLSYLKEHPELGWIGDGTNFLPLNPIDNKAYYKVILEALGYKQKIDGEGDFSWTEVLKFAESKGLKKVADEKDFTINSLAVATVEALNTPMKDSRIKLVQYLVSEGIINRDDAETLGLYKEAIATEVKSVRAISNSKVEVVFKDTVDESQALQQDMYELGKLSIKDVSLKNDNTVIIDTEAMSESTAYTLEINGGSYSFKGLKKDGYAPKLLACECKDTEMVELTFDRILDNHTAQDTDTYSIEGIDIKSASLDATNTKVRIATKGMEANKSYQIKIHNIKNGDGVVTKLITKRFIGRKDTTAPKLSKLTVLNNMRLLLEFTDINGLNKKSAEDTDHYTITSSGGELQVVSAKAKDSNGDGLWDSVELETESQEPGRAYTLKIKDITDNSVLGNSISKEIKKEFRGKSKDKTGPSIVHSPRAVTNTMVEIVFEDANALDEATACDPDNYEIDEDLEIKSIRIKDPSAPYTEGGRTILLVTSEMDKSETYTLEVRGVCDEFGNEMKSSSSKKYRFRGIAGDRTPPYITFVECINSRTIELSFDDRLDEESAESITNYRVDELALATKAELQPDGKTVRLSVSSLSSDTNHKIILNNIKDLSGNALSNVSISVLYSGDDYDTDPPELEYIDAINEDEIWVTFSEEINAENAVLKTSDGLEFRQSGNVLEDGVTVVMRADSHMGDREYEVTRLTGVSDIRGNMYELESGLDFYGTDLENDPPEVDYWDQIDVRTFRVVFTEPVLLVDDDDHDGETTVSDVKNPSGFSLDWKAMLNPEDEDSNQAYSTVDLIASKEIPADKEYGFNLTGIVEDYAGKRAYDENDDREGSANATVLESYMEDDEEPYIEYVEAITRTKVQVVFNEAIRLPGSYRIYWWDDDDDRQTIDISAVEVDSKDAKKVNIYTDEQMSSEYAYTLIPLTAATDIAGNRLKVDDVEIDFEGSDIVVKDYIQGIEHLNATTFKISKSSRISNVESVKEIDADGNVTHDNIIQGTPLRISDNTFKVTVEKPLLKDVRYEVTVDGLKYRFYGSVQNGGIQLDTPELEITYDGMDFDEHIVQAYKEDGTKLDMDEEKDCFVIDDKVENGDILYVYVKRESDGAVIYGTRIKVEGMPLASSSKEITSYSIVNVEPDAHGNIEQSTGDISVTVPYGTDAKSLVAAFTCSPDAAVKVDTRVQESGITENDFSKPVEYTVTAEDGSEKNYTVEVKVSVSKLEKIIEVFDFRELNPVVTGKIDQDKHYIELTVPYKTNVAALVPYIETTPETVASPESGTPADFSGERIYTVTAKDSSSQEYTVSVKKALNDENLIESFSFKLNDSTVAGAVYNDTGAISIEVPYGTDITKLAPAIAVSEGAAVTPASGEERNFQSPVEYVVKAQNGAEKKYSVSVNIAKNTEKAFKEFGFLNPKAVGIIDEVNHTINVKVPNGTPLTSLVPVFVCSDDAKVEIGIIEQKSGEGSQNFSNSVDYKVIAENGSEQVYKVIVTVASVSEAEITEFILKGQSLSVKGVIDKVKHEINATTPAGADVTNLVASFAYIGQSVGVVDPLTMAETIQTSGITPNNFTGPVVYKVIAPDNTTVNYTVNVIKK